MNNKVKEERFDLEGIFQIMKALKDSQEDKAYQLNEVKATLWVNFGVGGRLVNALLLDTADSAINMLLTVLRYYNPVKEEPTFEPNCKDIKFNP